MSQQQRPSGGGGGELPEPRSEQEVVARFQQMRQNLSKLANQLAELSDEAAEHDLVIKQLEPMDKGRRCYRMIGDVLVERTVAETLPAVQRNREGLGSVIAALQQQYEGGSKALVAFQQKYKIRIGGGGGGEDGEDSGGKQQKQQQSKQGGAGVLC